MIALGRYTELLRTPHLGRLVLVSLVGRLPIGTATLALVLFMQAQTGSFGNAGMVGALYVLGLALMAPLLGRLMDRFGPRPILAVTAVTYPIALTLVALLGASGAAPAAVAAGALLAGASLPPITVCMRALYPRLVPEPRLLKAAYSLDSALVETVFVLGPSLVAFLVALGAPVAAVVTAGACGSLGAVLFLRARAPREWQTPAPHGERHLLGPLARPGLRGVLVSVLFYAGAFGLFEMAVTGVAASQGVPAAAGVILAIAATGGTLGVLAFGSHDWKLPARSQWLTLMVLMLCGLLLLIPIENLYLFAATGLLAASPMAAVIAAQSVLVSGLAPKGMLAESFTWSATALLTGVSSGIAAGGALLEVASPAWVLACAAACTLVAICAGVLGLWRSGNT
ncbi:MAG TPA: MFS transporter [Burkholderiales bacterium]